jgi:hypothetical protein
MSFEFNGATACFPSQLPRQHESRSHNDGWQGGPQNSFTAAGLTQTPGGAPIGIRSTACRLGPSSPVPLYPQAFHRYPPPTPLFRLPPSIICNRYWRMEKKQHMRWTQRGAQMLLHASCALLNGELGNTPCGRPQNHRRCWRWRHEPQGSFRSRFN